MKKNVFIIATVLVMAIVSRFVVRIVDATVQIDDDVGLLIILLIGLNILIGILGRLLYKRASRGKKS